MTLGFGNQYSIQLSYERVIETYKARILPQIVLRAICWGVERVWPAAAPVTTSHLQMSE